MKKAEFTTNSVVKAVKSSEQMQWIYYYADVLKKISYGRLDTRPYFMACHKSTMANLNTNMNPEVTEWAHSLDKIELGRKILQYIKDNCTENYIKDQETYFNTKLVNMLAGFVPKSIVEGLCEYGNNNGDWDELYKKQLQKRIAEDHLKLKWTSDDLGSIEKGITSYEELCLKQPMFSILRHDATSCYPYFKKQSPKFIIDHYYDGVNPLRNNHIATSYIRKHGITSEPITGVETIKLRNVFGVEWPDKINGLPLTYSFKLSAPEYTPYYKEWTTVFDKELEYFKEYYQTYFGFTSDLTSFDKIHNSYLTRDTGLIVLNEAPPNVQNRVRKAYDAMNNPQIIMNAMYYIRTGKWISISGNPVVPYTETLNNKGVHDVGITKQNIDILNELFQIDDGRVWTYKPVDLEKFANFIGKHFGFIMNPDKTETSGKGFLVFLQNHVGHLFVQDPVTVTDKIWSDGMGYLSHVMRKIHRLYDRERINQSTDVDFIESEVNIYDIQTLDEEQKLLSYINRAIQRFLGTVGSFGPYCPEPIVKIILSFMENTTIRFTDNKVDKEFKFLDLVVTYCKSHPVLLLQDYGFSPLWFMRYLEANL